jgi:hypothetical protein
MTKKQTILIGVLALILCLGFGSYQYVMKGGGRNIETETADYQVQAKDLLVEFNTDAATATKKYLNKTMEISGNVTALEKQQLIIESSIVCDFSNNSTARLGIHSKIKGRLLGYDDLLGEIKLDQCLEVK